MIETGKLRFSKSEPDFFVTLNKRVNEHFKATNVGRHGNAEMYIKTVFMYALYFVPYGFAVSGIVTNSWIYLLLSLVMGLGLAGIGLSVMHDANHGAYSKKPWLNKLLGLSLNMVGGHAMNWKIQHNVLHHTYTNVEGVDEDIAPRVVMRFSPEAKWYKFHKYQHYYAWFFYGLLSLSWIVVKDFIQLIKYSRDGHIKGQRSNATKEWIVMLSSKAIYWLYIFVIPTLVLPLVWWQVLIGVVAMHYIAGLILSLIFQPAHVIEGTEYPKPDVNSTLENNWAIHQLRTTTNFAGRSRLFSWYVGGLNFQIEHHLFPHVCHVHYKKISKIVKQTTADFGLPYKTQRTFVGAIWGHVKVLKAFGQRPVPVQVSLN